MDYRTILDNAPVPILVVQDGRVVYCNASGLEVFQYCGYDVDESSVGEFDFMAMLPPEELLATQESIAAMITGGGPLRNIPRTLLDARGRPVQTLTSASLIAWEGKPAYELSYIIVGLYPVAQSLVRDRPTAAPDDAPAPSLRDARTAAFDPLTPQESKVAFLIAEGHTTAQIAAELEIRDSTLRGYIKSIYRKLEVHSRTELVRLLLGHR